jgi:hypothetical protein
VAYARLAPLRQCVAEEKVAYARLAPLRQCVAEEKVAYARLAFFYFQQHLKVKYHIRNRGYSSAGEHTTEARDAGVQLPVSPFQKHL